MNGNLRRAAVELAKDWRTDRMLRRLEALLLVADAESTLLISGNGDVLEPDDGVIAIGSGGNLRARGGEGAREARARSTRAASPRKRCGSPPRSASTPTIASSFEELRRRWDGDTVHVRAPAAHTVTAAPPPMTPREIVSELDRYIVGQRAAKRAVAIALRNRWRRQQVPEDLRDEIAPKNIIMIGPTGVGKTEISRRLAKLASAPFLKVEASKFTEVGYVGRDVESIIRDLVELAIAMVKAEENEKVARRAREVAEERLLDLLLPPRPPEPRRRPPPAPTASSTREKLRRCSARASSTSAWSSSR